MRFRRKRVKCGKFVWVHMVHKNSVADLWREKLQKSLYTSRDSRASIYTCGPNVFFPRYQKYSSKENVKVKTDSRGLCRWRRSLIYYIGASAR